MAADPELAPAGENHLLGSTSVVKSIAYTVDSITYKTFEKQSAEILRLAAKPIRIECDGKKLEPAGSDAEEGWLWTGAMRGGILRISHSNGNRLAIYFI